MGAPTIADRTGETWVLDVTVATTRKIRDQLSIEFDELTRPDVFIRTIGNPEHFVGLLWCICEGQAERRQVTPEEFGGRFSGDELWAAVDPLTQALVNFSPPWRREGLAKAIQKGMDIEAQGNRAMGEWATSEALQERIAEQMASAVQGANELFAKQLTTSPASSG